MSLHVVASPAAGSLASPLVARPGPRTIPVTPDFKAHPISQLSSGKTARNAAASTPNLRATTASVVAMHPRLPSVAGIQGELGGRAAGSGSPKITDRRVSTTSFDAVFGRRSTRSEAFEYRNPGLDGDRRAFSGGRDDTSSVTTATSSSSPGMQPTQSIENLTKQLVAGNGRRSIVDTNQLLARRPTRGTRASLKGTEAVTAGPAPAAGDGWGAKEASRETSAPATDPASEKEAPQSSPLLGSTTPVKTARISPRAANPPPPLNISVAKQAAVAGTVGRPAAGEEPPVSPIVDRRPVAATSSTSTISSRPSRTSTATTTTFGSLSTAPTTLRGKRAASGVRRSMLVVGSAPASESEAEAQAKRAKLQARVKELSEFLKVYVTKHQKGKDPVARAVILLSRYSEDELATSLRKLYQGKVPKGWESLGEGRPPPPALEKSPSKRTSILLSLFSRGESSRRRESSRELALVAEAAPLPKPKKSISPAEADRRVSMNLALVGDEASAKQLQQIARFQQAQKAQDARLGKTSS